MLLFNKKLDLNPNVSKIVDSVALERIGIRYGSSYLVLNNPKTLLEVSKCNFKFNEKKKVYELRLSKFRDLNMIGVINTYYLFINKIEGIKTDKIISSKTEDGFNVKLFNNCEDLTGEVVYDIPLWVAEIIDLLQDFSVSRKW